MTWVKSFEFHPKFGLLILKLLEGQGVTLDDYQTHLTPCKLGLKLLRDTREPLTSSYASLFRSLVGCLQYLTFTRPDIAFSVNSVYQFLHCPTEDHLIAAKRILRYVKQSLDIGIMLRRGIGDTSDVPLQLQAYCDADWAGDPNDRKSTTGNLLFSLMVLQSLGAARNKVLSQDLPQKLSIEV